MTPKGSKALLIVSLGCLLVLISFLALHLESERDPRVVRVEPRPARESGAVDVLLVVVDTERADFTSPYGAKLKTTPFLKSIADEGITFINAFSPAPWTVPAMFSMVTGLYPSEHGTTKGVDGKHQFSQTMPAAATTLAEYLKEGQYTTFGINTNYTLGQRFGFGQGFDRFIGENFNFIPFPNLVLSSLIPEMEQTSKYFLWLHYFDPHQPYRAHSPWFGQWNESRFHGYLDLVTDLSLKYYRSKLGLKENDAIFPEHATLVNNLVVKTGSERGLSWVYRMFRAMPELLSSDYRRFIEAAYSSDIRKTDEAMKEAFSSLGVDDGTLVIVTADHGEELLDHGGLGHHANSLYQELIRVPLVIRLPGGVGAGKKIRTPVSLIDVTPTVLDLVGLPIPQDLSGVSLKPLIEGSDFNPRPLFSEVDTISQSLRTIIEYPWKYIFNLTTHQRMLFNLERDPGERNNLVDNQSTRAAAMHERLLSWIERAKPRWPDTNRAALTDEDRQQLRALGYIE